MFSAFLANAEKRTVERKHPFVFFVQEFGSLRKGATEAPPRAPPAKPRLPDLPPPGLRRRTTQQPAPEEAKETH
jgi:hypothetical protein